MYPAGSDHFLLVYELGMHLATGRAYGTVMKEALVALVVCPHCLYVLALQPAECWGKIPAKSLQTRDRNSDTRLLRPPSIQGQECCYRRILVHVQTALSCRCFEILRLLLDSVILHWVLLQHQS